MRTDPKLKSALLKKLDVTPQRLSQLVNKVKQQNGPMSTPDATYVIAHKEGLDLARFLDGDTVDRVRSLVPSNSSSVGPAKRTKRRGRRTTSITIPGTVHKVDALLSTALSKDARNMTKVYSIYYVLENSMRVVIQRVLKDKHGKDWWQELAPSDVQRSVVDRKRKEDKIPWHGKRGAHEIFYSNFGDLRRIIEKNWPDFKELFPSRDWIIPKLLDLEHPRNVLAHHNPLGANDRKRVEVILHDWLKLLASKRDLLA